MNEILASLVTRYDRLLALLPEEWRGPASLAILFLLVGTAWHVTRKSGVWLILLVILVPALIPPLRGVGMGILFLFRALLERASV